MIFHGDAGVYTISIHEEYLFPMPKAQSDLDIGLPPETGDSVYLERLEGALEHARRHFEPEMIVYVAGSDPYERDPLGSLRITREGLLERDRRVARFAVERKCPLVALPAGGYTPESPSLHAAGFAEIARIDSGTGG
jgi:acetoin utilization deacetylase AcuC-like enzyme